jgi:hypothetical protein
MSWRRDPLPKSDRLTVLLNRQTRYRAKVSLMADDDPQLDALHDELDWLADEIYLEKELHP